MLKLNLETNLNQKKSSGVSLWSSDPWFMVISPATCSSQPGTFKQGVYHNIRFQKVPKNDLSLLTLVSERPHATFYSESVFQVDNYTPRLASPLDFVAICWSICHPLLCVQSSSACPELTSYQLDFTCRPCSHLAMTYLQIITSVLQSSYQIVSML